jgi:hypothetical protein
VSGFKAAHRDATEVNGSYALQEAGEALQKIAAAKMRL